MMTWNEYLKALDDVRNNVLEGYIQRGLGTNLVNLASSEVQNLCVLVEKIERNTK